MSAVRVGERKDNDKEVWYWLLIRDYEIIKVPYIYRRIYKEGRD